MIELSVNDISANWLVQRITNSMENLDEPLEWIGKSFVDSVRTHIDDQNGGSWPPPARDYGHALLRDTDAMYDGIAYSIGSDGRDVTINSDAFYTVFQDQGTSRIPPRPFLFIDDAMASEAEEILNEFIFARL